LGTNNNQEYTSEVTTESAGDEDSEMTVSWMMKSTPQDSSDGSGVEPDSNDED